MFKRLLMACCLAIAGCSSVPPAELPTGLLADQAFAAPSQPVDTEAVFALSPAMRRYLEVDIAPQLRREGRHRGLAMALYQREQLRLEYDAAQTRTAAEAFDARAGNCLSLVIMTAALARHLNLQIRYQAVLGEERWSRMGSLTVMNGHVNITVGKRLIDNTAGVDLSGALRLDFGTLAPGRGAALKIVDEARILSMFMNNRAAESLVQGDLAQAYAYAREAVLRDPGHAEAFNTLGVIYQRHGLTAKAERTFAHTLTLAPQQRAALSNLAALLESQQRVAEAVPLRQALLRLDAESPFEPFDLGQEALARGDYGAAREHLQRALRREPDYHEFHHAMAVALAGLGQADAAQRHLSLARDNSMTLQQQALYAGKLDRFNAQVRERDVRRP